MKKPNQDEKLTRQAKELFDNSVEQLDAATLSRLNRDRHAALAELERSKPVGQWVRWVPATGVAAAAVVAVVMWQGATVEGPLPSTGPVTDFEILISEDSLEMLEDLEFYSWIEPSELQTNGNVG